MRSLNFKIFLLYSLISTYGFSQYSIKEIKSIQDSIQFDLKDTVEANWIKPKLNKMIELLNNPDSLFPYMVYDSVLYFRYGTEEKFEPRYWNNIYSKYAIESKRLDIKEVNSILITINNPLNFNWEECGTPFIEGAIIFYNSGNQIAKIEHACSGGQIFTNPNNALIKFGVLNEKGYKEFYKILN